MKKRKFKKILLIIILSKPAFFIYATFFCIGLFFLSYFGYKKIYESKYVYLSPLPLSSKSNSNNSVQNSSNLTQLLSSAKIETKEITSTPTYYKLVLPKGEEVYISKKVDLKTQVASLQLIISRLTIEAKSFSRLDFRYEKPVMVLK